MVNQKEKKESIWLEKKSEVRCLKDGDVVLGAFRGFEKSGKYEGSYLFTLENPEDGIIKFWGNDVLRDKLEGVEVGTQVKIDYLGKKMSRNDREYRDYAVFVAKNEG